LFGICKDDQHKKQDWNASTSADDDDGDSNDDDDDSEDDGAAEAGSHVNET